MVSQDMLYFCCKLDHVVVLLLSSYSLHNRYCIVLLSPSIAKAFCIGIGTFIGGGGIWATICGSS